MLNFSAFPRKYFTWKSNTFHADYAILTHLCEIWNWAVESKLKVLWKPVRKCLKYPVDILGNLAARKWRETQQTEICFYSTSFFFFFRSLHHKFPKPNCLSTAEKLFLNFEEEHLSSEWSKGIWKSTRLCASECFINNGKIAGKSLLQGGFTTRLCGLNVQELSRMFHVKVFVLVFACRF